MNIFTDLKEITEGGQKVKKLCLLLWGKWRVFRQHHKFADLFKFRGCWFTQGGHRVAFEPSTQDSGSDSSEWSEETDESVSALQLPVPPEPSKEASSSDEENGSKGDFQIIPNLFPLPISHSISSRDFLFKLLYIFPPLVPFQ